jgi:hypothetical protein
LRLQLCRSERGVVFVDGCKIAKKKVVNMSITVRTYLKNSGSGFRARGTP